MRAKPNCFPTGSAAKSAMPPPTIPAARCDSVEKNPPPERLGAGARAAELAGFDELGGEPGLLSPGLFCRSAPAAGVELAAADVGGTDDDFPLRAPGPADAETVSTEPVRPPVGDAGLVDDVLVGVAAEVVPDVEGTEPVPPLGDVDDGPAAEPGLSLFDGSFQPGAPLSAEVGARDVSGAAPPRTSVAFKSSSGFGFLPEDAGVSPDLAPPLLLEPSFLSAMLLNTLEAQIHCCGHQPASEAAMVAIGTSCRVEHSIVIKPMCAAYRSRIVHDSFPLGFSTTSEIHQMP